MRNHPEPGRYNLKETMAQQEYEHIRNVLIINRWHQGRAALDLGITQVTLHLKMKKYKLLRSQQGERL